MDMKRIMVVGAGQMGTGIAQICAQAGLEVTLYDEQEVAVDKGMEMIKKLLKRSVDKERITAADEIATIDCLHLSTDIEDAKRVDIIVEAVIEDVDVKKKLFTQLDALAPTHAILATNTSSLPITEIAAVTQRPEQVIGMHFMNPVPVMKLVEIIRAIQTSDATYNTIAELAKQLNKTAVRVNDFPGFVANRVVMPMINEAIYTVYEGVSTVEDVDTVMELGMNHPMGPLKLADFIGLDTCLFIMEVLYEGFGDNKYHPCPLLRQYVQAGWYGRKSGQGFYVYE